MRIGLVAVDSQYPNYALMKISAYYKKHYCYVEWANSFEHYDIVYKSKIFNFTPDDMFAYNCDVLLKGGTGYSLYTELRSDIEYMQPDYSLYPQIDSKTAYGFLTRGCPNKCKWCVVPIKEGNIKPYMDVEEIAIGGRTNLILMDNNVIASEYGLSQIEKIIKLRYRVDFNQALDARLVTEDIAKMLADVRWINQIKFGCDTPQQISDCERAMNMIDKHRKTPMQYLLYTMINDNIVESYNRLSYFRKNKRVRVVGQPYRDFNNPHQIIPQWQRDMARWSMRREIWTSCDFKNYTPRKNFKCNIYFIRL